VVEWGEPIGERREKREDGSVLYAHMKKVAMEPTLEVCKEF
jgi:hypothetical protein